MAKRSNRKTQQEMAELREAVNNNHMAMTQGPQKKRWALNDLQTIRPQTAAQEDMFESYLSQDREIVAYGTAGTGKTFVAAWLAMNDILNKNLPQKQLIIVRSNVSTREVGHLPGDLEEKMRQYEQPYREIFTELFNRPSAYDDMKACGLIQFMPTSFIRGVTWHDSVVLIDEAQNMNFHEINSVMTRLGHNAKVFIVGDTKQNDLKTGRNPRDLSGLQKAMDIAESTGRFALIKFTPDDIMRGDIVRDWVIATECYEDLNE